MPQVIIPSNVPSLDGSLRSQAYAFIDKLRKDDTLPGLHIEPMEQAADKGARTGRVNKSWRAVLIKLTGSSAEPRYVYLGTFRHDDAIAYARSVVFQRNPHSGVAEVIRVDLTSSDAPGASFTTENEPAVFTPATSAAVAPAAELTPALQAHGITFEDLIDVGISPTVAHRAILATDQDRLLEVAMAAPSAFQTDALLMLGDGATVEQIRTTYGVGPVPGGTDNDTDDDLIDALDHPASQMQFTYLEDDDDLRAAIEDEDFARWRVFLHPEQRDHAETSTSGAYRLSGGAGTGKTVVLLHRARYLHRQNPGARIVLTTYNKTLATSLRDNLLLLDKNVLIAHRPGEPGIYVGTVDAVSWHLISQAAGHDLDVDTAATTLLGRSQDGIALGTERRTWDDALRVAGWELPEPVRTADFLATEYSTVVLPTRITTRDAYLRARRQGRGVALGRTQRSAVWDVIEAYRTASARRGSTDYDEKAMISAAALDTIAANGGSRVADHVLVDEAQDLAPARLMLLRALVATGADDLFLAEDSQQRIYAPHTVLSRYGIHVTGRSRRLRLNYRTTAQNLTYATSILAGQQLVDLEQAPVDATGFRSARSGPPPATVGCDTLDEAYDNAIATIRAWLAGGAPPETIAVLVRTRNEGDVLLDELAAHDVPIGYIGAKNAPAVGRVSVMTMHRSKGMEFRNVLLFGATDESVRPFVDRLPDGDRADALQRERSLLYVATTRARDRLAIIWDGAASELLPQQRLPQPRSPHKKLVENHSTPTDGHHDDLAREMHDTLGSSLARIALQASALEAAPDSDSAVREASAHIRAAARQAGDELRGVLNRLRTGAEGHADTSFDDLTDLLTSLKEQGARITSSVFVAEGHTAPGGLTRTCYRLVQESVTNAIKHAPGMPIDITLRGAPATGVTLIVHNPLPEPANTENTGVGSGITGMRHRATSNGGTFTAAARGDQFVVDARLPWTNTGHEEG